MSIDRIDWENGDDAMRWADDIDDYDGSGEAGPCQGNGEPCGDYRCCQP